MKVRKDVGNVKKRPWPREQAFNEVMQRRGIALVYEPHRFRIGPTWYKPDFLCPETGEYYEVVGSRSAWQKGRKKIAQFRSLYVDVVLHAVSPTGEPHLSTPVPSAVSDAMAKWGRKGGKARARSMREGERKAASKQGGHSRWAGLTAEQRARAMAKVRAGRAKKKLGRKPEQEKKRA